MTQGAILLVEDNASDIGLTKRAFAKKNIANPLAIVQDGQEAMDYLFCEGPYADRSIRDKPSVILLDINLPKLNGLSVLRRIREDARTKLIPVIMLTTSMEEQDLVASYSNGANSYIRKPVDFAQFLEAIGQLGMYWLILNETPQHA